MGLFLSYYKICGNSCCHLIFIVQQTCVNCLLVLFSLVELFDQVIVKPNLSKNSTAYDFLPFFVNIRLFMLHHIAIHKL